MGIEKAEKQTAVLW